MPFLLNFFLKKSFIDRQKYTQNLNLKALSLKNCYFSKLLFVCLRPSVLSQKTKTSLYVFAAMNYPHLDDYRLPMPSSTDNRNGNLLSSTSSEDSQFPSMSFGGSQRNNGHLDAGSKLRDTKPDNANNNNNSKIVSNYNFSSDVKPVVKPEMKSSPFQAQKGFEAYSSKDMNSLPKNSPDSQNENNNNNSLKSNMNQKEQKSNYQPDPNPTVTTTTSSESYRDMQEMRYSQMNGSSYGANNEGLMTRIGMSDYDLQNSSHRSYDGATAFERYDPTYVAQRNNLYSTYQPSSMELNNHQKYMLEQQQQQMQQTAMLKQEIDDNTGPVYPRPMYHYDPSSGTLPPGFSAINLSVKAAQAAAFKNSGASTGPIMDLSINNISSTSPSFRLGRSPQPGTSPNLASPQVPGSPNQTLDLSVNRLSQR
jgi:hypothetical protein